MVKTVSTIALAAICLLALSVFTPQARADASPSGTLVYACAPCSGSVSFAGGGSAPFIGSGINLTLSSATFSNGGDEVGGTFTLAFNTGAGTISLTDADGDFNLSGTIVSATPVAIGPLGEVELVIVAAINGVGPAGGQATFVVSSNPTGGAVGSVEAAHLSVVTPEPGSLLLMGTGLLTFGGVLRRRFFS